MKTQLSPQAIAVVKKSAQRLLTKVNAGRPLTAGDRDELNELIRFGVGVGVITSDEYKLFQMIAGAK